MNDEKDPDEIHLDVGFTEIERKLIMEWFCTHKNIRFRYVRTKSSGDALRLVLSGEEEE